MGNVVTVFSKINLSTTISMKSSGLELSDDMVGYSWGYL